MKSISQKMHNIGSRAAQIKQALAGAPAKVAQVREAVRLTSEELHKMKTDVQSTVAALRVNHDEDLSRTLREIDAHTSIFAEVGYELAGVELEIGMAQRLIVHLEKVASVSESEIRSVLSANVGSSTMSSLLSALLQAEQLAQKVNLSQLSYGRLTVHMGANSTARVCWYPDEVTSRVDPAVALPRAADSPSQPSLTVGYGEGSFFQSHQQSAPGAIAEAASIAPHASSNILSQSPYSSSAGYKKLTPDWKQNALARFKNPSAKS